MINFRKATLADKGELETIINSYSSRSVDYAFQNLVLWADYFGTEVAVLNETLLIKYSDDCYAFPIGKHVHDAIIALMEDAKMRGKQFKLSCSAGDEFEYIKCIFPEIFRFEEDRNSAEYLYDINRMCSLEGRKLHQKRNNIHRFEENYPNWSFEPITKDNIEDCSKMSKLWYAQNREFAGEDSLTHEEKALNECLDNYEAFGMDGGLIKNGEEILAFTIGRRIGQSDALDINFEKSFNSIQGGYTIIFREFSKYLRDKYPDLKYLNREEDMGLAGLRKAKLSYQPDILLEKFIVTI